MAVPQVCFVPQVCPRCAPGVPEIVPQVCIGRLPSYSVICRCTPGAHLGHTWGTPGAHLGHTYLGHTWGLPGMMCPRCALCPTRCARDVHLGHTWGTKHTWGTHISGTTTISAINDRQNSVCYAFCVTSFHFFFQRFAERIS